MSDQGGYGWRAGRVANPWSMSRVAEKAAPIERRQLCLLLLSGDLQSFPLRAHAEDLLSGPGVLGVDPPRLGRSGRMPASVADGLAVGSGRRIKLPGFPRVLVIFHPLQYPHARGLIMAYPDAELWYWRHAPLALTGSRRRRERLEELHLAASFRATLIVVTSEEERAVAQEEGHEPLLLEPTDDPHTDNAPLWERLEARGIETGRLGSERLI
jgi:hypothetical protein